MEGKEPSLARNFRILSRLIVPTLSGQVTVFLSLEEYGNKPVTEVRCYLRAGHFYRALRRAIWHRTADASRGTKMRGQLRRRRWWAPIWAPRSALGNTDVRICAVPGLDIGILLTGLVNSVFTIWLCSPCAGENDALNT